MSFFFEESFDFVLTFVNHELYTSVVLILRLVVYTVCV